MSEDQEKNTDMMEEQSPAPEPEEDENRENDDKNEPSPSAGTAASLLKDDEEEEPEEPETPDGEEVLPETGEEDGVREKDPNRHIRRRGTGQDDLPELERADEGLSVRLTHGGDQELDELLFDREEREKEEEQEEIFSDTGFDEEAEKQKKEEFLEKEKLDKKKTRKAYSSVYTMRLENTGS